MRFTSFSTHEDGVICEITLDTIANNENVSVSTTFASGYAVNVTRSNNLLYIDVLKGSMYFNEHLVFEYDEGEFECFMYKMSNAESDFEVGFAYGRLIPLKEVIE